MAYSNGTYSDQHDLLEKIKDFVTVNGWTLDVFTLGVSTTTEGRLSIHNASGIYMHMISKISGFISYPEGGQASTRVRDWNGLCVTGATGYNAGQNWYDQPGYVAHKVSGNDCTIIGCMSANSDGGNYWFSGDADGFVCIAEQAGIHHQLIFGQLETDIAAWAGTINGMYFFGDSGWYNDQASPPGGMRDDYRYTHLATEASIDDTGKESNGAIYTAAYRREFHPVNDRPDLASDQAGWHHANSFEVDTSENNGNLNLGCRLHGANLAFTSLPVQSTDYTHNIYQACEWCGPSQVTGVSPMSPCIVSISWDNRLTLGDRHIYIGQVRRIRNISNDAFNDGDITTLPSGEEWQVFPAREDGDGINKGGYCILKD